MLERLGAWLRDRYRVEREIGAGGMATVYLAHDLRHDRPVAIKVFRPELSALLGSERFLHEIKVTAHLQHPHILALYDSGSADGLLFYVMPWVEGESLGRRLERERMLPVSEAVRIAREVADALDYAHRQGVIHRDIKPDNILLHDGRAIVADFGIALAVRNAGGSRLTQTGLSLGTPQYMSPEQATAERELDARSDVYSLGCVLYEMLAGEPPHTGPTSQAILARIIADRPRPITELRETVPRHVAAAVHTALAKLAADRFASAAQLAEALARPEWGPGWPSAVAPAGAMPANRWTRARLGLAVAAVTALVLAGGWLLGSRRPRADPSAPPPSRLSIPTTGLSQSGSDLRYRSLALTPDGSALIYAVGSSGDRRFLMLHRLVATDAEPIPGGEGVYGPDLSPDGRWLFGREWRRGGGVRLPVGAGTAAPTHFAGGMTFGAWHPDGSLWLSREPFRAIERIAPSVEDSPQVRLSGLSGVRLQQILDDGHTALALEVSEGATAGRCVTLDLRTGRVAPLVAGPVVQARYTAGYLVYAGPDGALLAVAFDPATRRVTGEAVPIAAGILLAYAGEAQFAVARNGTVAYIPTEPSTLVLLDRAGNARLATQELRNFHNPRFSPDGRRISVDFSTSEGRDVWVLDRDQNTLTRVSFDRDAADAAWTPDGRSLTYRTDWSGQPRHVRIRPGSGMPAETLYRWGNPTSWLPDGSGFVRFSADSIGIVRNGGRGPFVPMLPRRVQELSLVLSPDGRWLAFVSSQNGQREVFVRRLDGQGEVVQVSQAAGAEPVWGSSGRELFYRTLAVGSEELVVARLELEPRFRVLSRTPLFPIGEFLGSAPHANYDVSPDGRTLVMVRRSPSTRIVVIQNLPGLVRGERRP